MADDTKDLDLAPEDAGLQFRAEMWATNFLLGNWKALVAALILALLSVLAFGQISSYRQRVQRHIAAEIADAERLLPVGVALLPDHLAQNPDDPKASDETLAKVAAGLEAIAGEASGTGSLEALLKAAELYRLAGKPAEQRACLERAAAVGTDVLGYTAQAALANLELEQGQGDAAVARFRTLMTTSEGMLAQQAAFELGLALEHLDRDAEAGQVYADFLANWPDSPRAEEARSRQSRLTGGGAG